MTLPSPVGWLLDVLGVKDVFDSLNNAYPRRQQLRFLGNAALADNPTLGTTDVTIGGGQVYTWSAVSAPAVATPVYPCVIGGQPPNSFPAVGYQIIQAPFVASYFSFVCGQTALATDTITAVVMKNGLSTALTFVIPAGSAPGVLVADSAHTVSFARGDNVSVRLTQSGATAQAAWFGLFQLS